MAMMQMKIDGCSLPLSLVYDIQMSNTFFDLSQALGMPAKVF